MNSQKVMPNGFYMHYKKKLYRLVDIAVDKNNQNDSDIVIYQPQYGDNMLWVRPKKMFFEDLPVDGGVVPRFTYLGKTLREAQAALHARNIIIEPAPIFRMESSIDRITEFSSGNIILKGAATHSETLSAQIIYMQKREDKLYVLSADKFFDLISK